MNSVWQGASQRGPIGARIYGVLLAFVLSLLLGPEVVSERFPSGANPAGCAAAALASHGGGIFLAWSSSGPDLLITTTYLDGDLAELPGRRTTLERPAPPHCLQAAMSDRDVVLVWSEPASVSSANDLWAARFARDGSLLDPPRLLAQHVKQYSRVDVAWSPWNGGTYLIVAGAHWLEGASGDALGQLRYHEMGAWRNFGFYGTGYFDSLAPAASAFALTARFFDPPGQRCGIPGYRCSWFGGETVIGAAAPHWVWPAEVAKVAGEEPSSTTVACIGNECLTAWIDDGIQARWPESAGTFMVAGERLPLSATIASASDGHQILLVWESSDNGRIRGVVIATDGVKGPFVIAEGADTRRQPAVVALGPGRFLVAYEITPPPVSQVRLGGRIVLVQGAEPARRRSVGR